MTWVEEGMYLFASPFVLANILVLLCEDLVDLFDDGDFFFFGLVGEGGGTERATSLFQVVEGLFNPLDILETELCLDDFHVAAGVDVALDVDDLCVIKGADDLEDTVDGTDVGEESVSKTSASGGTGGEPSDIDAGEVGGDAGGGLVELAEPVEALIGDWDAGLFGIDGRVGKVGGLSKVCV